MTQNKFQIVLTTTPMGAILFHPKLNVKLSFAFCEKSACNSSLRGSKLRGKCEEIPERRDAESGSVAARSTHLHEQRLDGRPKNQLLPFRGMAFAEESLRSG